MKNMKSLKSYLTAVLEEQVAVVEDISNQQNQNPNQPNKPMGTQGTQGTSQGQNNKPAKPPTPQEKMAAEKAKRELKNQDTIFDTEGQQLEFVARSGTKITAKDKNGRTVQLDNESVVVPEKKPGNDMMHENIARLRHLAGL